MFKKIKEKRELRKAYKNAKIICVINGANIISNINEIVEKIKTTVDENYENVNEFISNDLKEVLNFIENMNSEDFQEKFVENVINKNKE